MDRNHPALRVFALVLFVALLAGATALAYGAIDRGGLPAQVNGIVESRTTSPGHTVAHPVAVDPTGDTPLTVAVTASAPGPLEAEAPRTVEAPPNGTGFYVNVTVPADAPTGDHDVRVVLAGGGASRSLRLPVTVEEPDQVVTAGDTASVEYVGRFPNGSLFGTNVKAIDESPLPRVARYQAPGFQPIDVPTGPGSGFIEGFSNGLVGVGVGHDVTLTLAPHEAYGNETVQTEEPRDEEIQRYIEERALFNLSRQRLEQKGFVNETSEEGDEITVGQGAQTRTYVITFLNETQVELRYNVTEGDRWTHHSQWPNSSVAVDVNETHVRWEVRPPVDQGEPFTWYDYWPNATVVAEIGEETITLRHTPEEGLTYTKEAQGRAEEHTVVDVQDDAILVERKNRAPLAGETIVFDITIVDVS